MDFNEKDGGKRCISSLSYYKAQFINEEGIS